MLASYRHADDVIGSANVLPAVRVQLTEIEQLVKDTTGPTRTALLYVAQQWAQFTSWLYRDTGNLTRTHLLNAQTAEWAAEIGDRTMTSTVLTERALAARQSGDVATVISAGHAAQQDPRAASGQRADGAHLEARGHAMARDHAAMERVLGRADRLVALLEDREQDRRPWSYWMSASMFRCSTGITFAIAAKDNDRYCGRALSALESGYAELPADQRSSSWAGTYLAYLADIYARSGNLDQSVATALTCAEIAARTGSSRLTGLLTSLSAGLTRRYPGDPRVTQLAEVLA
jgi:hypothetical protein